MTPLSALLLLAAAAGPAAPPHPDSLSSSRVTVQGSEARLELRVGLEALLDGLPDLKLDPDAPPPEISGYAFRGPERLAVWFDAD